MNDTLEALQQQLAAMKAKLPGDWPVAFVAVMPGGTTKDQAIVLTDDLAAITPALLDVLAARAGSASLERTVVMLEDASDDLINMVDNAVCDRGCSHPSCKRLIDKETDRAQQLRAAAEAFRTARRVGPNQYLVTCAWS